MFKDSLVFHSNIPRKKEGWGWRASQSSRNDDASVVDDDSAWTQLLNLMFICGTRLCEILATESYLSWVPWLLFSIRRQGTDFSTIDFCVCRVTFTTIIHSWLFQGIIIQTIISCHIRFYNFIVMAMCALKGLEIMICVCLRYRKISVFFIRRGWYHRWRKCILVNVTHDHRDRDYITKFRDKSKAPKNMKKL
jgi:hypothetical protein